MKTAILINDTSNEYHIGCYNVVNNIIRLCSKNKIEIIHRFNRRQIMEQFQKCKKAIEECDIIIINGEGSLHHHPKRNTFWFTTILRIIPKNKKSVLINTVWQQMDKLVKDIKHLDKLNLISVRESYSYKDLLKIYPNSEKIIITPDIIFATEIQEKNIGYGDSISPKLTKYFQGFYNHFPLNYIREGTYLNPKKLNMPSLKVYLTWLKSLNLYITGRFHGTCLAAMTKTPFVVFASNSHKIEGMLKDMNCSDLLVKSFADIDRKKELAIKLIPKAHKYAIEAKQKIEDLFKRIAQL